MQLGARQQAQGTEVGPKGRQQFGTPKVSFRATMGGLSWEDRATELRKIDIRQFRVPGDKGLHLNGEVLGTAL